jgi:peptide/nickel transport system substrate-binding protein
MNGHGSSRKGRRLAISAVLVVAMAACTGAGKTAVDSSGASGLGRDPGTLVVAVDAIDGDFDPASSYLVNQAVIWLGIYEGLLRLKGESASEVEPLLADSWEPNEDASSWTFHLHPGVTFSDGTPFDADAVKANYVRTITGDFGTGYILGAFIPKPDKQIVVEDPLTVRFDLAYPYPRFDVVLAAEYGTGLVSPAVFTEHSTGPDDRGHEFLQGNAIGTGPYMLKSFEAGNQAVLVRNPTYWRGWDGSHFDTVILRSIPEAATRRQLIESGEVDIAYAGTAEDTAAIRDNPNLVAGAFKNLELVYIILGEYGPLASPEARQAMNYLFPYDEFVTTVMKDTFVRANGPFPDLLFTHDPNVFTYDTDIQKARQLLSQAGVEPGTQLTYEYYTGFGKEAGLVLQQQLEKVGLELRLIEKEFSAFNADLTTDRPVSERANMYYWSWWPDYDDPSDYSWIIFSSDAAPDVCSCYNSGYYHNAEVDQIIDDGFQETDPAALTTAFATAQDLMTRVDPPVIAVGQHLESTYFRDDIQGHEFNPLYIATFDFYALHRG